MRYEALKPISLENIKIENKSHISEYQYSIEKIHHGKYHQGKYIIKTLQKILNYLTKIKQSLNLKDNNHLYKNNRENEIYSKFWWNIGF